MLTFTENELVNESMLSNAREWADQPAYILHHVRESCLHKYVFFTLMKQTSTFIHDMCFPKIPESVKFKDTINYFFFIYFWNFDMIIALLRKHVSISS